MHPALNPRVVKEADTLSEVGCNVSLIAPNYSGWAREADKAFASRPWRVIASPKFGPLAPPLTRGRELTRRGLAGTALRLGRRPMWALQWYVHPATPDLIRAARATPADLYI